jgi:DNA (cytosine-5)-methyltransferase 1
MAAEVEKLLGFSTEREAREFLRARCNLPSSELSTYVRFAKTLKGSDEILRKARASFPVIKALVAADPEAREEIVERMDVGARVDNKEIAAIRKRLRVAKLTPGQIMAERHGKLAKVAARKTSDQRAEQFKSDLFDFVIAIIDITDAVDIGSDAVRARASDLKETFESLFGSEHRNPEELKPRSAAHELSCSHLALVHLTDGTLPGAAGVGEIKPDERHPWLLSLYALTGRAPGGYPSGRGKVGQLPPAHHRPKVVELCAGAGGMAIGLERAGYEHVALVEFDKHAAATLRLNRPHWNVIEDDIRSIDFTIYRQLEIDLVCGGPPCQPYASEGYKLGKDDERDLLPEMVRVVNEIRPRCFLFENVDGLLHARHADHIANILRGFRKSGYQVEIHRARAEDFGVAQERSRVLIVGLRADLAGAFRMPPSFPDRRSNIGDVLADLLAANGWKGAYEWARDRREQPRFGRDGEVIGSGVLASTIVTRRGKPREKEAARWGKKCVDIAGLPDRAPTAEEASTPGFLPALTARMRARLQDFPDDWKFVGGKQSVADQIGNAVPSTMAAALGLALASALREVTWDWRALLWPETEVRIKVAAPPLEPIEMEPAGALETVE